jgi:hypothetical protein
VGKGLPSETTTTDRTTHPVAMEKMACTLPHCVQVFIMPQSFLQAAPVTRTRARKVPRFPPPHVFEPPPATQLPKVCAQSTSMFVPARTGRLSCKQQQSLKHDRSCALSQNHLCWHQMAAVLSKRASGRGGHSGKSRHRVVGDEQPVHPRLTSCQCIPQPRKPIACNRYPISQPSGWRQYILDGRQ